MICPECGERYNFYEPKCPWCGAVKPVVEKKQIANALSKVEHTEKESEVITYEPRIKRISRYTIGWNFIVSLFFSLSFLFILSLVVFSENIDNGPGPWVLVIIFFLLSVIGFLDVFSAMKRVQKIKCYKDRFELYSCYDKMAFSYDKSELYKIKHTSPYFHSFGMIGFYKDGKSFFVDGNDFPEFVKEIKSIFKNLKE